jgi:hypothetical protein
VQFLAHPTAQEAARLGRQKYLWRAGRPLTMGGSSILREASKAQSRDCNR